MEWILSADDLPLFFSVVQDHRSLLWFDHYDARVKAKFNLLRWVDTSKLIINQNDLCGVFRTGQRKSKAKVQQPSSQCYKTKMINFAWAFWGNINGNENQWPETRVLASPISFSLSTNHWLNKTLNCVNSGSLAMSSSILTKKKNAQR